MSEPHFEPFFAYLSGIYRDIQRLRAQFSGEFGVKSVHIFWIYLLREHPEGLTAAELAQASQTTGSLVSREITELAEKELIYADALPGRRRYAWKFHLTESGQAMAGRIDRVAMQVQTRVSRGIPAEDLDTFYDVLAKLFDGFSRFDMAEACLGEEEDERTDNR